MRIYRALLAGYYGFGNLGDELLARSTISLLERSGVRRDEILIASAAPAATEALHGVRAVDRWSPATLWRTLRVTERLILGGGGLFQDVTSCRSSLYYAGLIGLARRAKCRVWALGQSVGPLATGAGRRLARWGLWRCDLLTVRDEPSMDWCRRLGVEAEPSPDLVLGLGLTAAPGAGEPAILVNFRPWKGDLVDRAARAVTDLSMRLGLPLRGVAMAPEDRKLMEDLAQRGVAPIGEIDDVSLADPLVPLTRGRMAFGMRLHFAVLALLAGRACQTVAYDPKVSAFTERWGGSVWEGQEAAPVAWTGRDELTGVEERLIALTKRGLEEA